MERRVVITPVRQPSPAKKYLRCHPLVRAIVITIAFSATLALAGALINWATSHISGNTPSPNPPPIMVQSFPDGSCLAGDFAGSSPKNVSKVPCYSADASYQVIEKIPGGTDTSECQDVEGATLAYLDQKLENGIPISSDLYCLGSVGQ
jgi:hypothetical protein